MNILESHIATRDGHCYLCKEPIYVGDKITWVQRYGNPLLDPGYALAHTPCEDAR